MPRSRRIRGGLASPVIAALINSMPDPNTEWPLADRQRWLSALQAAMNLAYQADHDDDPPPEDITRREHERRTATSLLGVTAPGEKADQ